MRAGLLALVLAACGCNNPTYLAEKAPIETQAGMMGYGSATDLYVLPVRRPTATERQALVTLQHKLMLPDPVPWAQAGDFDIEIEYSVRNLDMLKLTAFVYLDGGNEFGDYVPANYVNPLANAQQQTPPPHLVASEPFAIAAGGTITAVFREDDLHESALNLEAITRYPSNGDVKATPFMVILNHSNVSSIGRESVPPGDITPAHVRYQITVAADGHVGLDYTVRVRDHNGKLAKPTDMNLYVSTAAMLAPPAGAPY